MQQRRNRRADDLARRRDRHDWGFGHDAPGSRIHDDRNVDHDRSDHDPAGNHDDRRHR
jgi:hypothetical protein